MITKLIKSARTFFWTTLTLRHVKEHGSRIYINKRSKMTSKTSLGDNCHFNGARITGDGIVRIGSNFHSGGGLLMITSFHNYDHGTAIPYDDTYIVKDIIIEDNVWLGENVTVLAGVTIGEGAIIQAGSVVVKDIPSMAVAGGHPAKVFKYRDEAHYLKLKEEKKYM